MFPGPARDSHSPSRILRQENNQQQQQQQQQQNPLLVLTATLAAPGASDQENAAEAVFCGAEEKDYTYGAIGKVSPKERPRHLRKR